MGALGALMRLLATLIYVGVYLLFLALDLRLKIIIWRVKFKRSLKKAGMEPELVDKLVKAYSSSLMRSLSLLSLSKRLFNSIRKLISA